MPGGGGLLQLVAKGKQDVFLTGNPQVSWFKMVYRRYTNFATESQPMYFDGSPNFGKRITCNIPRRGDLLGRVILEVTLPALTYSDGCTPVKWVNSIGHALIQEVSVEIGEVEIDKQTGEWMEIWSRYVVTDSQKQGFYNMIGKVDNYNPSQGMGKLYIPLQFWFCRNPGSFLPLLALQYHQVRINMTLRPLNELIHPDPASVGNPAVSCIPVYNSANNPIDLMLYGDYVYLDTEERRRFVSTAHEYLIEQIQYTSAISIPAAATTTTIPIEFNHPIKEFFWYIKRDYMINNLEWFNFSSLGIYESGVRTDLMNAAVIQFDGFDRFNKRDAGYFRLVQPYQHHSVIPSESFIYSYSIALRPEEAQPTGSVNASRIDSLVFQIDLNTTTTPPRGNSHAVIYAINNNVFRVVDGFGGLLFSV
jgi:hypothetical protein